MNHRTQEFLVQHQDIVYQYPAIPESATDKFEWIMTESDAPWLELTDIVAPYADMLEEARALKDRFVYHRSDEDGHQGWRSIAVHGIASDKTGSAQSYGLDPKTAKYDWTDIADQCPVTVNFFKNIFPYRRYDRLRFMLLDPKGYISPHNDHTQSYVGAAVNISLNNPLGCRLVTNKGTLPFKDSGSIFLFNNNHKHVVYNDSDTDRFHIVLHGEWDSPRWNPIVIDNYQRASNG